MVAALAEDKLDGLCVGEPWNAQAEAQGVGRTIAYTSDVWPDHPEKVLACRREFVRANPNTARALVQTMLEACRWLDGAGRREDIARWLARPDYIGIDEALIAARLGSEIAASAPRGLPMRFFDNGAVNYPHAFEGAWFLTQFERWGMLDARADYAELAARINQTQLYREAAARVNVTVPGEGAPPVLLDGEAWSSATSPVAYAQRFAIRR